jgi:hypothetical protein
MNVRDVSPVTNRWRRLATGGWRHGFALVVTLSLMALLVVLAVGLLSLSTISLRTALVGNAQREAESNARMAMLIALGELQKTLGPDQRVSARASAVVAEASQPHLLGVWHGWRWKPELNGKPDYHSKSGMFERWLASTSRLADAMDPQYPARETDGVWLIDPADAPQPAGSTGMQTSNGVRAGVVTLNTGVLPGGMAWAVFDENAKASMDIEPGADKDRDKARRLAMRTAPERPRPDVLSAELGSLKEPHGLITFETAGLKAGATGRPEIRSRVHDLGVGSLGVLANAADGGLKTDLTTLLESKQPVMTTLGEQQPYLAGVAAVPGVPQWEYLRAHYAKYKKLTGSANGRATFNLGLEDTTPAPATDKPPVGQRATPVDERLLPVIAKLQILFSVVSHYNHLGGRIDFFDQYGDPKGNTNYAAPHLVYDPVITLWNPYDVALDLTSLRIRVWDPPVGFQFKKNDAWLRDEFGTGVFEGVARFQIQNEGNPNARRFFTLHLRGADSNDTPGANINLLPGEVKVFSPWVEKDWTWAMETAGGYSPRVFFDWNANSNFGNIDHRTQNPMGVETIPGWDTRAGLQIDHLSYSSRPDATRYEFEKAHGWNGGWLCIKLTDTFTVNAKPMRTLSPTQSDEPDFGVDLLAARNPSVSDDILRSFDFRFGDVTKEISTKPDDPVIQRTFRLGDILQKPNDKTPGGKTPFAVLTMTAKTTVDPSDLTKAWLYNNPVIEGATQDTRSIGLSHHSYDIRFEEVQDFNTFPGIEIDGANKRGFFGASATANRGVSAVPMFRVPRVPAASLGDWIPANLVSTSRLPRVNFPFGNSWAHPLVPADSISYAASGDLGTFVDHSYLLNDSLWDRFYFSTACAYDSDLFASRRTRNSVLEDFFAAKPDKPLLNRSLVAAPDTRPPATRAASLNALDDAALSHAMAAAMLVRGPFNVNSDSVDAWRAVLSALRDEAVVGWANRDFSATDKTAFARTGVVLAGDADKPGAASFNLAGQIRWAGFRALKDDQIKMLATTIVGQIRKRGQADKAPFLSTAEFVNRRIGSAGALHVLRGLLQTAIDEADVNKAYHRTDSKQPNDSKAASFATVPEAKSRGVNCQKAMDGLTGEGAPSFLTQGDLLMPLAAVMTVRGDTFRIRAYGESRNAAGQVLARARCEATVQRLPAYIDPTDTAQTAPAKLKSQVNQRFGRRFVITGFRWLAVDDA